MISSAGEGGQILPGRYRANASPGCAWERLQHFDGTPNGIIAAGSVPMAGPVTVEVQSGGVGFMANDACGTWTRLS